MRATGRAAVKWTTSCAVCVHHSEANPFLNRIPELELLCEGTSNSSHRHLEAASRIQRGRRRPYRFLDLHRGLLKKEGFQLTLDPFTQRPRALLGMTHL